jgi:2-acylglycerol O-acyltransferase 2
MRYSINTKEAIEKKVFDPSRQYLVIWHPHGTFTVAAMYFFSYYAASSAIFSSRGKFFCAVADLLLNIPGLAEFLLLCNARSIGKSTVNRVLKEGCTLAMQPGGIHEQVHTDHRKEVVYFPAKLGFIRLAIEHGLPLLPIYAFGENQLFYTSDWLRNINIWLYRQFKVGSLFLHGLFGLPVTPLLPNPLLLPNPGSNMDLRWGEPVEVGPADSDPSDEKVRDVFARYCASLQKLFDKYKHECLPKEVADLGLEIILRSGSPKASKSD